MQYCRTITSYTVEQAPFTAIALLTTAQFLEAREANYTSFQQNHLQDAATAILQIQFYQLIHWTLLFHRLKGKSYDKITRHLHPRLFTPSNRDIATYIDAPRFLWRFSKSNVSALTDFFNHLSTVKEYSILVEPYYIDTSLQLDYLYVKRPPTSIPLPLLLHDFHSVEYTYSLDFHLHKLKGDTTYQEFVLIIITGCCPRYNCGLYKLLTKYPLLNNRHYNLKKLLHLIDKNSSDTTISNKWHISTDWTHEILLDITIFPLNYYALTYMALGKTVHINNHFYRNLNRRFGWNVNYSLNEYIDIIPSLFWRPVIYPFLLTRNDRSIINHCQEYFTKLFKHIDINSQSIISYPYIHPYLDESTLPNIKSFHIWLNKNGFSTGIFKDSKNDTFRFMSGYNHLFEESEPDSTPKKVLLKNLFSV